MMGEQIIYKARTFLADICKAVILVLIRVRFGWKIKRDSKYVAKIKKEIKTTILTALACMQNDGHNCHKILIF